MAGTGSWHEGADFSVRMAEPGDDLERFGPPHHQTGKARLPSTTVVANHHDSVVGVATGLVSSRHPDLVFASVTVDEKLRRCGIGSALVEALSQRFQPPLSMASSDEAGAGFLSANRFDRVVESTTVRVDTALADRLADRSDPPGVDIRSEPVTDEIEAWYEAMYRARHLWAGTYRSTAGKPWIRFAGPVLGGLVLVARDTEDNNQPVVAIVSVHGGPFADGADGFIAPTGVTSSSRGHTGFEPEELMATMVGRTMVAARAAGLESVNLEFDSTHWELATTVARLPAEVIDHHERWVRRGEPKDGSR